MFGNPNNYTEEVNKALLEDLDEELSEQFTFDGFEVVRGEFFSHFREPIITFVDCKFYANAASVNKLPDADYVQFLVNQNTRKIAIKPCSEDDKDSFLWRRYDEKKGRYVHKYITCKVFYAKIVELMGWNPNNRYRLLGKLIKSGGDYLFVFDLDSAQIFQKLSNEGEKTRRSRTPIFPAEWKNQFGLTVEEHNKQLQVNIFDGYAVFDITKKENDAPGSDNEAKEEVQGEWQDQTPKGDQQ